MNGRSLKGRSEPYFTVWFTAIRNGIGTVDVVPGGVRWFNSF